MSDPDLCNDLTKHSSHSWGWRKGSPIQCPGSDVFRGENKAMTGRGPRLRLQDRNAWIEDHLPPVKEWGDAVPHAHLYQERAEGLDVLMVCAYPSCNHVLRFFSKPEVTDLLMLASERQGESPRKVV